MRSADPNLPFFLCTVSLKEDAQDIWYGAFVHTHEQLWGRLWRRDFCDRAKMRRAYLEGGASHYG